MGAKERQKERAAKEKAREAEEALKAIRGGTVGKGKGSANPPETVEIPTVVKSRSAEARKQQPREGRGGRASGRGERNTYEEWRKEEKKEEEGKGTEGEKWEDEEVQFGEEEEDEEEESNKEEREESEVELQSNWADMTEEEQWEDEGELGSSEEVLEEWEDKDEDTEVEKEWRNEEEDREEDEDWRENEAMLENMMRTIRGGTAKVTQRKRKEKELLEDLRKALDDAEGGDEDKGDEEEEEDEGRMLGKLQELLKDRGCG